MNDRKMRPWKTNGRRPVLVDIINVIVNVCYREIPYLSHIDDCSTFGFPCPVSFPVAHKRRFTTRASRAQDTSL